MVTKPGNLLRIFLLLLATSCVLPPLIARAASCKAQSQMTVAERNALSGAARLIVGEVQSGDMNALRAGTIPAVLADFSGIEGSVNTLRPLVERATVTVDSLYALDASGDSTSGTRTDFYCGTPVVALHFDDLPPGTYGLAILHLSGVAHPQQVSLILSKAATNRWMLAGLFTRPMMEAGHDGLWYWVSARRYSQRKMQWNAWLLYRIAAYLLVPADFLSSPNLEKEQQEEASVRPDDLPGAKPLMLEAHGSVFQITAIDTTTVFGALDLEVHYSPDASQAAQLADPPTARKQVTEVMTALLALHPEIQEAFHGVWVQADQHSATNFSLQLPMEQIPSGERPRRDPEGSIVSATGGPERNPTRPETQASLEADHDPIPSPDGEERATVIPVSPAGLTPSGELQKRQDGLYTMHQDVDEVLLSCAVVDGKSRQIRDLSRGEFRIWEDGVPQVTTSFLHQDQPVSLGILVDNSGSMLDKRSAVKEATLNLLRASNPMDTTFIVNFSDRAVLDQGFTTDMSALNRGLSHFDSKGTTALYDAVAASADELAKHGKFPKQVLLVITDGADNASHLTLEEAIRRVQNLGGPVVYSIGLLFETDKQESERGRSALEALSQETGGIAFFPHSLEDVDGIATEVAQDIRDQYTLGYRSTKPARLGGYRAVRVETVGPKHGKLVVRTRKGYYAKKPSPQGTQRVQEVRK